MTAPWAASTATATKASFTLWGQPAGAHGDRVTAFNELEKAAFTAALDKAVVSGTVVTEGVFPGRNTVNTRFHQRLSNTGRGCTLNDNSVEVRKVL